MRIIVIEDNPDIARSLQRALESRRHTVDVEQRGFDGEAKAASDAYDLILLDLMLPDRGGMDICSSLRRHGIRTPIMMLTSLSSTDQKVNGLRAGADDYVTKPFEVEELLARIEAIARRTQGENDSQLRYEGIEMDLLKRQVKREGKPIRLTVKEFDLLECFLRSPHQVLSKTQLGARVWEIGYEEDSNVIEVYVSRLRKKIDYPFGRRLLHTAVGTGYMLSNEAPAW